MEVTAPASDKIKTLLAWWEGARRGRSVPDRSDFDPLDYPKLLPNLLISEWEGCPPRIHYRLIGTEIAAYIGVEITGRHLDEVVQPEVTSRWMGYYREARQHRRPVMGIEREGPESIAFSTEYAFGIFPVTAGDREVRQFICVKDFLGYPRRSDVLILGR